MLKSAVEEEARLQSSLLVSPDSNGGQPLSAKVQQYAAGGIYHPGQPAPLPPPPKQKPALPVAGGPAHAAPAAPAPKWNYTATPHNGVMSWDQSHAVELEPPAKPSSLVKLLQHYIKARPAARQGTNAVLLRTRGVRYQPPPGVRPLVAVPQLSAKALQASAAARSSTWEEWYQRVARTIYDQWRRADVGPGNARVHVTVWRTHDVDCQVADFSPACDAARNAAFEAAFREASNAASGNLPAAA